MTKKERVQMYDIAARLEEVINHLNKANGVVESKERVCIIYEQVAVINSIVDEIMQS